MCASRPGVSYVMPQELQKSLAAMKKRIAAGLKALTNLPLTRAVGLAHCPYPDPLSALP